MLIIQVIEKTTDASADLTGIVSSNCADLRNDFPALENVSQHVARNRCGVWCRESAIVQWQCSEVQQRINAVGSDGEVTLV